MATILLSSRSAFRRHAIPLGVALSTTGLWLAVNRQSPLRLDAAPSPPAQPRGAPAASRVPSSRLDPAVVKQLSSGSLAGLCLGVLVSVFSRTLVLFIGLAVVAIQVASRYGIDLAGQLKLKQRIQSSRILSALNENAVFKLSFGVTFAMSAFMHF